MRAKSRPVGPEAFDYVLPPEQVAQSPAVRRADARLLVVGPPRRDASVGQLQQLVPEDALVVVNASRVVPARLQAHRTSSEAGGSGRTFELLMCAPGPGQGPGSRVSAWVRGAKKLREGDRLGVGDLRLRYGGLDPVDPRARWFQVEAGDVLEACRVRGATPLPPYIQRPEGPKPDDAARYQTVYASKEGSVAAPTAGLHFERAQLDALDVVQLHLHVGPGTFLPMDVQDVQEHRVGAERVEIDAAAAERIEAARAEGRPIVAVGTTVTRALEGVVASRGRVEPFAGLIDLVITPGFSFRVITHLLTNFHLPRSSLLMLVCSFAGRERTLEAYAHAVQSGYRFYSYGDAMLCSRFAGG